MIGLNRDVMEEKELMEDKVYLDKEILEETIRFRGTNAKAVSQMCGYSHAWLCTNLNNGYSISVEQAIKLGEVLKVPYKTLLKNGGEIRKINRANTSNSVWDAIKVKVDPLALRRIMKKKHMNQRELSLAIGKAPEYISHLCNREECIIRGNLANLIASVLRVGAEEFLVNRNTETVESYTQAKTPIEPPTEAPTEPIIDIAEVVRNQERIIELLESLVNALK